MSSNNHQEFFIRKYIFSTDHKWIGIQYGVTSMVFLLFGFILMMIMRYQLAYNTSTGLEKDLISPDMYNALGAMHGTIMVFLGVVPMVVGAFGNYLVPLQIGAPDMAFPKLNMASYWAYFVGGVIMLNVKLEGSLLSTSVAVRVVVIVPPSKPLPLTAADTGASLTSVTVTINV